MIHERILASIDCPMMWRFCASERPCAAVTPCLSSMRSSRILPLGSCSVLLEYISPGPGMPCFRQNAWDLGRLLSSGRAKCGRSVSGMCLEIYC
jgi:hypothetical protein